ncbi:hypothetical protein TWF506_003758 [Arthrobotrys conoides]|uniref:F-box domain-containing protein n=1 Tax=Arthrobotrys conoides TaxID=74498 RepID=A0AAN8RQN7_9PEZI
MTTETNIFSLPNELQAQILSLLPWHDHFPASQVCPLWLSILRTEHFRRQRHYGNTPPDPTTGGFYVQYYIHEGFTYHGTAPRRRLDDDRSEEKLESHGLNEAGLLRIIIQRGRGGGDGGRATTKFEVLMPVVERIAGHTYKYDCKIYDIAKSGLLETDVMFFGLKDKEPGSFGLADYGGENLEAEYGEENNIERDTSPYWTINFKVKPWTPGSEYEAGFFVNPLKSSVSVPDVKVPPLRLRRDVWESKEATLKNFIEALKAHFEMVFFNNPGVTKCLLDVHLITKTGYMRMEKVFHVSVKVKKEGDGWGLGEWAKGFFWKGE